MSPTSLTASIINSTAIRVSWEASIGGADGYIVAYNNTRANSVTKDVSTTATTLSGLSPILYSIFVFGYRDILSDAASITLMLAGKPIQYFIVYYNHII